MDQDAPVSFSPYSELYIHITQASVRVDSPCVSLIYSLLCLCVLQDVFTISVGNLPPGATVLIKVMFITELVVRAGTIIFSLPASVAPWQQSSALNQKTQVQTGP